MKIYTHLKIDSKLKNVHSLIREQYPEARVGYETGTIISVLSPTPPLNNKGVKLSSEVDFFSRRRQVCPSEHPCLFL